VIYRWDQNNSPFCPRCSKDFNLYTTLIKHTRACANNVDSNEFSDAGDESDRDTDPLYSIIESPFGYISQYRIAICMVCQSGVLKEHLKGHAKRKHKIIWNGRSELWNECIGVNNTVPTIDRILDCLPVSKKAYQCMECFIVLPNHNSRRYHKFTTRHQTFEYCTAINIFKAKVHWQRVTDDASAN